MDERYNMKHTLLFLGILLFSMTATRGWAQDFSRGDGSPGNPFIITTAAELDKVRNYPDKSFELGSDIDLKDYLAPDGPGYNNGQGWQPIGTDADFVFDGKGFAIKGLWINKRPSDEVGFLGYLSYGSTIRNLTIEVAIETGITGNQSVGALAGTAEGTIQSCYITGGKVDGTYYVGGLIGQQYGTIINSYATVDVEGDDYVGGLTGVQHGMTDGCFATGTVTARNDFRTRIGGLVGLLTDNLKNSYATGAVIASGNVYIGSLVGEQRSTIENCYATGAVTVTDAGTSIGGLVGRQGNTTITASYYNTETTGMTQGVGEKDDTNTGTTGLKTEQMIVASSYNWTIGTPGIGSDTEPWVIGTRTYPYLYWQTDHIVTVSAPPTPPIPPIPNFFRITLPTIQDVTTNPVAGVYEVRRGDPFSFTLTLTDNYQGSEVNVYANNRLLEPVSVQGRIYFFRIDAVYETYDIRLENPLGIDSPEDSSVYVYTVGPTLYVEVAEKTKLAIYTLTGHLYTQRHLEAGTTTLTLPRGIYLVKSDNRAWKICSK